MDYLAGSRSSFRSCQNCIQSKLYEEFHIAFSYGDIVKGPEDHQQLTDIIDSFGPMTSLFMPVPTEKLAPIIEDAIMENLK